MRIQKAESRDLSRIAETLVFVKRIHYRPIFQNGEFSFGALPIAKDRQKIEEKA